MEDLVILIFILFCWALLATIYAWQLFKEVEWYAIRHGDIKERSQIKWYEKLIKIREGTKQNILNLTMGNECKPKRPSATPKHTKWGWE